MAGGVQPTCEFEDLCDRHGDSRTVRDEYADVGQTGNKMLCNLDFARSAVKSGAPHALVLDTHAGSTTGMLAASGFGPGDIVVPNPNPDEAPPGGICTFFTCTSFEWLRDVAYGDPASRGKYSVFLDFCCTWRGCKTGTQPKLDVAMLFLCGLLPKHGGVLALTLSLRGFKGTKEVHNRVVHREMCELAREYGYNLCLKRTRDSSTRRVQFLLWETCDPAAWPRQLWVNAGFAAGLEGPWLRCSVVEICDSGLCVKDSKHYHHTGPADNPAFISTSSECPIPTALNSALKQLHFYDTPPS